MEFTGERFLPGGECGDLLEAEHVHRYRFAAQFARGKNVLDIACGSGYGSRMLREAGALTVTGVDLSAETINFAVQNYCVDGIRFMQADATRYRNGRYELIVSFETLEHLEDRSAFLSHLYNMTAPDGMLIISTPNKSINSPMKRPEEIKNPYHKHEYTEDEFTTALRTAGFASLEKHGQHLYPKVFANQIVSRLLRRRKFITKRCWTLETAVVSPCGKRTPKYFVYTARI